jgi:tetratricopeptide (TPR) repeat protein
MRQPTTEDELLALHGLCQSNPQGYLQIMDEWIRQNPRDANAYFSRHYGWLKLGVPDRALDDLNKVIEIDPSQSAYLARGKVLRQIGDLRGAIGDYEKGEALNPAEWKNDAVGPYFQADCHARLGDEATALAYCRMLPNDFWTPGLFGAPAGGKTEIAAELRAIAAGSQANRI